MIGRSVTGLSSSRRLGWFGPSWGRGWYALHFAHVESEKPENAFYTRIQGRVTLIEIDNTEHVILKEDEVLGIIG